MQNAIENKLAEMLTENTGRSFLDSGGYYGRHWQRNQGVDLANQPEGIVEFWTRDGKLDVVPTIDVYHWLKGRLEYNQELDERYRKYVEREDECLDVHSAESFAAGIDGQVIYGNDSGPITVNTYNGEDLLSQIIQFVYWTDDDGAHIMLQIHGGCDARGGYTYPVAFDVTDYDGTSIFDNARATIYCNDCDMHWDTYDGYTWDADDGENLNDYYATEEQPNYPVRRDPLQRTLPIDFPQRPKFDTGVIWVDDEHNGHCPYCGGTLHVAPWPAS